jgi:hypothetical protein
MGAARDDGVNGQSNKEWTRAGNGGRLVRNESGSGSHMVSIPCRFHYLKLLRWDRQCQF